MNDVADPIRLFLALRAGDRDAALGVLDRRPDLVEAPERWKPTRLAQAAGAAWRLGSSEGGGSR